MHFVSTTQYAEFASLSTAHGVARHAHWGVMFLLGYIRVVHLFCSWFLPVSQSAMLTHGTSCQPQPVAALARRITTQIDSCTRFLGVVCCPGRVL
jgi:hypothetical protein